MIRKYTSNDVESVVDVWSQASVQAHSFLSPEFVVKAQRDLRKVYLPATETWIYEKEGEVVGFISMLNNEIGGLFVLPQFQDKGIGSALVNFVAIKFLELEVEVFDKNSIGRAFYDKYGFRPVKNYTHDETGEIVRRLKFVIGTQ